MVELVFDNFEYPGEVPDTVEEGDVYSVRTVDGDRCRDIPLFIRPHLVDQDKLFQKFFQGIRFTPSPSKRRRQHITRRHLYITGPLGCGKTVFTTFVAHRYAATENKRVLMILFREYHTCHIFIIEGHETLKLKNEVEQDEIVKVVKQLLGDSSIPNFDLCILDGVRQSLHPCGRLIQILNMNTKEGGRIERVVHTTSLQFEIKGGDTDLGNNRLHENMEFDSFTQADYLQAITEKKFLKLLLISQPDIMGDILIFKRQEENIDAGSDISMDIEEKEEIEEDFFAEVESFLEEESNTKATRNYFNQSYYYGGGSARYVFESTALQIKESLFKAMKRLQTSDWASFATRSISPRSSTTVNSLMQRFGDEAVPVSRYVLFEAYDHVDYKLVEAVQGAADQSGNPALKGWAFELQQLQLIKTVLRHNSLDDCRVKKNLKSSNGLCFQPIKNGEAFFDGNKISKQQGTEFKSGTIIWCMKWNQGCFDVAFFKGTTLLTLQFTVSDRHSLKIQYIKALKTAIENESEVVNTLVHVGVVGGDEDTFNNFQFQYPEGQGLRSWEFEFILKTYKAAGLVVIEENEQENLKATYLNEAIVYSKKRNRATDTTKI